MAFRGKSFRRKVSGSRNKSSFRKGSKILNKNRKIRKYGSGRM